MGGARQLNASHLQYHLIRMHHSSTHRMHRRNSNLDNQAIEARHTKLRLSAARADDSKRNTLWHQHFTRLLLH